MTPASRSESEWDSVQLAFDTLSGSITEPSKGPNGYLIIKVLDRKRAVVNTLEDVSELIRRKLEMPRIEVARKSYIDEQMKIQKIETSV